MDAEHRLIFDRGATGIFDKAIEVFSAIWPKPLFIYLAASLPFYAFIMFMARPRSHVTSFVPVLFFALAILLKETFRWAATAMCCDYIEGKTSAEGLRIRLPHIVNALPIQAYLACFFFLSVFMLSNPATGFLYFMIFPFLLFITFFVMLLPPVALNSRVSMAQALLKLFGMMQNSRRVLLRLSVFVWGMVFGLYLNFMLLHHVLTMFAGTLFGIDMSWQSVAISLGNPVVHLLFGLGTFMAFDVLFIFLAPSVYYYLTARKTGVDLKARLQVLNERKPIVT
ncbi:MAG: hypothetical protein U5N86_07210 [Planctomycetota bacterium]|nr:hypothetical protein [Planctomycetota bacterium]